MVNGECFGVNDAPTPIREAPLDTSLTGNPDLDFALLHGFCKGAMA